MNGEIPANNAPLAPSRRTLVGAAVAALTVTTFVGLAQPASAAECAQPPVAVGTNPDLGFERADWPLDAGLSMFTYDGHLDRDAGGIEATTRTSSDSWVTPNRGAVLVVLRNECGDVIGVTRPREFDVAPRLEFWRAHDETVRWADQVAPEIARRTASVDVVHERAESAVAGEFFTYRAQACAYWRLPLAGPPCPVAEMILDRHGS